MNFDVFCDESGLESLKDRSAHKYMGIGGIWMPSDFREDFKSDISRILENYNFKWEIKWNKVSPYYLNFNKELVDYFFKTEQLRFRVVLIEASRVDNIRFNNSDIELGFYKFYYQLLHHWIYDFNEYNIFLDLKENREKGRLKDLLSVLQNANLTSIINRVQGLPSDESLGIQIADLFTGLVTSKFNNQISVSSKKSLIEYVENKYLGNEIAPTAKWVEKFNIFKLNLSGGW